MYNRYIPQSDGTFRKSRVPEPPKPTPGRQTPPRNSPQRPEPSQPLSRPNTCPPMTYRRRPPRPEPCLPKPGPCPEKKEPCAQGKDGGIGSFLRQLLPKGLCTEDLIVVLLLLLMCADSDDNKNNALLTLVIYLFL